MLFRDAIDGYLLSLEAARGSPRTIDLYRKTLGQIATFAETQRRVRVDQVTLDVVRAAVADAMQPKRTRPHNWKGGEAMAYSMVCAIRALGAHLRKAGVAVADFGQVELPKVPERIQVRVQPDEFRHIEAAILRRLVQGRSSRFLIARDLAIINLLADTGLRAAECCSLNVQDIDLEDGMLTVHRGKWSKPRVLSLRDAEGTDRDGGSTLRALRDYLTYRAKTFGNRQRALWLTIRGNPLAAPALRKALASICEDAGLVGSRPPHTFRRGYFTDSYREQPTALPILTARMGWSPKSRHMIEVYTRGADIDLAREQPQPLNSKRWRGEKDPLPRVRPRSMLEKDVGLRGVKADDPPLPNRGRTDRERAARQTPRGLRPPSYPRNRI